MNTPPALTGRSGLDSGQWCERHWAPLREMSLAGTGSALVGSLDTMQRFIDRLTAEGALRAHWPADKKNAALAAHAPICCYLGDAVMQEVYDKATRR